MSDAAARELAAAIRTAVHAGGPIVVTGCGTSETRRAWASSRSSARRSRAAGLPTARRRRRRAGLRAALDPPSSGLVIGVSHEGGTGATNRALRPRARPAPARRSSPRAADRPPATVADIVVETGELDQSWCHTVGYV